MAKNKNARSTTGDDEITASKIARAVQSAEVPGRVNLPEVKAPSLDQLEVTVPSAADVTEEEVARQLHEIVRMQSQVRDREMGEVVAFGDQVLLQSPRSWNADGEAQEDDIVELLTHELTHALMYQLMQPATAPPCRSDA